MQTIASPTADRFSTPPARGALAALSLSMLLSALGTSVATVALPALADGFAMPFQAVQWVVLAYLLAITCLIVGAGRLGDRLGRRRVMLAGLALFTAASALCAAAPSLGLLVAARAVQGVGAAAMMALTVALVGQAVPRERTGGAMGLLGTLSAVGTALGPSLGGALLAGAGWRAVFAVLVPVGLLALLLAWRCLPADGERKPMERGGFDGPGTLVLAGTLAAYALALTAGRAMAAPLLLVAALGASLFLAVEARAPSPLVRLSALRDAGFGAGLAANALVSTVMMATLVVGPFYLSRGLGLGEAAVGLALSVGPVASALGGVPAGRLVDRWGTAMGLRGGLALTALGALGLALLPGGFGLGGYVAALAVLAPGYQMFQAANSTAAMAGVPAERRGVASGMLGLSRNLGLVTGASAMGALFAAVAGSDAAPQAAADGLRATFLVAAGLAVAALALVWRRGPARG